MIWNRDPLWAKAKLFLERAFEQPPDSPLFGLWCSLGLEMLARTAVASVSSTLLAESDRDHKNLLHALGVREGLLVPKSITASHAFTLCQKIFSAFTNDDVMACNALSNRRNAELHSAEAAFDNYPTSQWLPGFYHACSSLVGALNETLDHLLGPDQAHVAEEVLQISREGVADRVKASIEACKKNFEEGSAAEREAALTAAKDKVAKLVHERHHKVLCPACESDSVVKGDAFGPEKLDHEDGDVVIRQSVIPRAFDCSACGLKLSGYAELEVAKLAGIYKRRTTFSPEAYYGLIDPESADMSEYLNRYLASTAEEYDNE